MGFFSWKTSDTQKSISNSYSCRGTFPVYMITEDGQVFLEEEYEGYGQFGGKSVYALIEEMNNVKDGINLTFLTLITNGERTYKRGTTSDCDFFHWETPLEKEGGKTPNELIAEGWKKVYPNGYGEWGKCAANGYKMPKFVENPPSTENYQEYWNALPYPVNCPDQGYFYPDNEVEDEDED